MITGSRSMSTFRVLMVCTANYCRSPIAEQLLAAAAAELFGAADPWIVASAGTDATDDRPIHPYSAAVLAQRGITADDHQSRLLRPDMLRHADLILTAAREHRSAVVRLLPAAIGRTFTMLQFARLAALVPPLESPDPAELGRALISEAKAARPLLQPVPAAEDDLPDPMGLPLPAFETCAQQLDLVVATMLRPLSLSSGTDAAGV